MPCAEDLGDANLDNIVDDPDDEAGGATFLFEFGQPVLAINFVLVDIDQESAHVTVNASDHGNNSVQTLDLTATLRAGPR